MKLARVAGGRWVAAAALATTSCAGAGGGAEGRDAVPESRDVVLADGGPSAEQGYEYVARRPLALVALAEARGLPVDVARAAIDQLADALDTCATQEGRKGTLASGAARLVAQIDGEGRLIRPPNVRFDPAPGVAQNAVVCLVAPAMLLTFPPSDAGVRGLAIEALWGSVVPKR